MPTYRAGILNELIAEKNLVIKELEQKLGYSNGGLGNAIRDNSKLKQERVDRLFSTFPDLNPDWLAGNSREIFVKPAASEPDTEKPAQEVEQAGWRQRYYESLEINNAALRLAVESQADAIKTIQVVTEVSSRAEQAAQKAVDGVNSLAGVLQDLKENIDAAGDVPAALQVWVAENFGKFVGRDAMTIATEIGQLSREAHILRQQSTEHGSKKDTARDKSRSPA